MGLMDEIRKGSQAFQDRLVAQIQKYKSRDFADATMAVCALVAAADGKIDQYERAKTSDFILTNSMLSVFNEKKLKASFEEFCDIVNTDELFGKIEMYQKIKKLEHKIEYPRL